MLKISGKAGTAGIVARVARRNRALLSGTALTAFVAAGMFSPMSVEQAQAANECGNIVAGAATCSVDVYPGTPAGNTNGGIEYTAPVNLTLNPGVGVTSNNVNIGGFPPTIQPGNGITIGSGTLLGVTAPTPVSGDITVTAASGTTINAQANGMALWTDGTGNDIVVNANGSISSGGAGILAHTGASLGPGGAGSVTINHTGHIQTTGTAPGIVAWVSNGTNNVEINNTGNATIEGAGDGIVIGDPGYVFTQNTGNDGGVLAVVPTGGTGITGYHPSVNTLIPSSGTGTVTNGSVIDVGGNGIIVHTTGAATVTNTVDGSITSGGNGIQIGGRALGVPIPSGGSANVTNDGEIDAGNHGITVFNAGGGTIANSETGKIHAAGNGINVGTEIVGIPTPSFGNFTVTNDGDIGTAGGAPGDAIGGVGIQVLATGTGKVINNKSIVATSGGITNIVGGDASVISPGDITTTNGTGVFNVSATGTSTVDTQNGTVTSENGTGIFAAALTDGDVTVDSGRVDAGSGGITLPAPLSLPVPIGGGVVAFANQGNATVNAHDTISVDTGGVFGAAAISASGAATVNAQGIKVDPPLIGLSAIVLGGVDDATVNGQNSIIDADIVGMLAFNNGTGDSIINAQGATVGSLAPVPVGIAGVTTGGGDVDINGDAETMVTAQFAGIVGYASDAGGNVFIDSGTTTVFNGVGVMGVAEAGNVDIHTFGDTNVGGPLGLLAVGGFASGDVDIDLHARTVANTTGAGVIGVSFDQGDVDIEAEGSAVNANALVGILGLATEGNVYIDSGYVEVANGSGVVGVALDGNVNIETHGQTTADGALGLVGVGGFASGDVDIDLLGQTVTNNTGAGVIGVSFDVGDVDIEAEGSTVNANALVGILGLATEGNVYIDAGTTTVANGSGVIGVALDGNVDIDLHRDSRDPSDPAYDPTIGNITANGLVGVAGIASGDVDIDLDERTISNTAGAGVIGVSFDQGDVDIEGEGSTVNAQTLVGVFGLATEGNVYIDSGSTTVINGSGVVGVAIDGNVDIDTHGQTTAGGALGLVGVGGFASGDVDIDLLGQTVTNTTGIGVTGLSFGQGDVDIEAEGSTINSNLTGILAVATDGNVYVDSGTITSQNGSGVIAFANNGNADVDTHGKISADNGLFGAAAFSVGGNATVTVGADIDPPLVGASAVTFGPGLAHADILDGVLVQADAVGVAGANFGTGNVLIDIGNNATIESGGVGILATKAFGAGGVTINVETGARVEGDVSGVVILAGTPGADNAAVLNNDGLIQGNGFLSPVIFALTDGGVTINNEANGVIRGEETQAGTLIGTTGDPLGAFEPAIVTAGGGALVNNDGQIHGSVAFLSGEDNTINNTGLWNTGGLNFLGFGGNDEVSNTGTVRTHLLTVFAGLEDFNNEGGLLTAQDGVINDVTVTTGNFNGRDLADPLAADSVLAFDATLRPLGTADLLVIGGNATGATLIDVQDLDGGPGAYTGNDDAILFALVDGNTDVTNFYTNGGYDKGLFRYDAYLRDVPLGDPDFSEWVLASTLDREAYEFPVIGMGAQNLWHASTGTWLDRTADLRSAFGETGSGIVDLKNEGAVAAVAGNVTPGAWLKLFGGTAERDFSNTSAPTPGLLGPSYTYDSKWNQDHYGFMVGLDGGRESLTASGQNQAWLVGIMGGYTGSNLDFGNSETDVDYKVGSVGAYVTYLNGGFFADAALKADFGKIDYSSDLGGGFGDSFSTDFKSVGVTVDTGYRFNGATGWFFEPKATLSYVRTTYDDAVVLGTGVSINDADSLRGRLGARLGTQMVSNGNIIEPWLEASAWHEFKGDYTATLTSNGFNLPVSYDVGGTFGEVAGGANFIHVGNGWSGFAKGAVQFGDDSFLGFSGNLGVRKTW